MNIILVSNKMAKAKTITLWQVAVSIIALVALSVMLTLMLAKPKQQMQIKQPDLTQSEAAKIKNSTQTHLDAYAKELGELQARIMRLDAQNQRLARLAGEKVPSNITADTKDELMIEPNPTNRGGPLVNPQPLSEEDLKQAIKDLVSTVDMRDEYQNKIEAKILQKSVLKDMLPNSSPVSVAFRSSSYGWRLDPFNGHKAFHEGLDFPANTGSPIYAAADGIVIAAHKTPDYGNLVKVDHGSGLETRYAHASKLLVKVGERVVKGQKIALVGSTGRSTGPHLHYEIRLNGSALDPRQYLNKKLS